MNMCIEYGMSVWIGMAIMALVTWGVHVLDTKVQEKRSVIHILFDTELPILWIAALAIGVIWFMGSVYLSALLCSAMFLVYLPLTYVLDHPVK